MAQANSDNPGTNGTLDKFFSVFTADAGGGIYKNVDILINEVFCADDGAGLYPWVGIASHGPQFRGAAAVKGLYKQIFKSFPDIWWGPSTTAPAQTTAPVSGVTLAPRVYSNDAWDPPTVGVQTTMVGTLHEPWFPDDHDPRFSLPLSGIQRATLKRADVPSFAVFVFGAKDPTRVSQVSFYMDRYSQTRDLQPGSSTDFGTGVRTLLQHAQDRADTKRLFELNQKSQLDMSRLVELFEAQKKER
jgi:hypothetical protein